MKLNFVFDNENTPNGIEEKLQKIYITDYNTFGNLTDVRMPKVLKFFDHTKEILSESSKGIYAIELNPDNPDHFNIKNIKCIIELYVSDLARKKIKDGSIKLVFFLNFETYNTNKLLQIHDLLLENFEDFTLYTRSTILNKRDRFRHICYDEILILREKEFNVGIRKNYPYINLNDKKLFNILAYGREILDFRAAAIQILFNLNAHKNSLITVSKDTVIEKNFTKNTSNKINQLIEKTNFQDDTFNDVWGVPLPFTEIFKNTKISFILAPYFDFYEFDYPFLNEKIIRAAFHKQPFLILSQQGTLKAFRSKGYKTFHPYINENYDNIENNDERFFEVIKQFLYLNKLSQNDLNNFFKNIDHILNHNYNTFYSIIKKEFDFLMKKQNDCIL